MYSFLLQVDWRGRRGRCGLCRKPRLALRTYPTERPFWGLVARWCVPLRETWWGGGRGQESLRFYLSFPLPKKICLAALTLQWRTGKRGPLSLGDKWTSSIDCTAYRRWAGESRAGVGRLEEMEGPQWLFFLLDTWSLNLLAQRIKTQDKSMAHTPPPPPTETPPPRPCRPPSMPHTLQPWSGEKSPGPWGIPVPSHFKVPPTPKKRYAYRPDQVAQ